jgi:hypothetical protein
MNKAKEIRRFSEWRKFGLWSSDMSPCSWLNTSEDPIAHNFSDKAVQSCGWLSTFQRNILPPSSGYFYPEDGNIGNYMQDYTASEL